jgi:hypothetical protein
MQTNTAWEAVTLVDLIETHIVPYRIFSTYITASSFYNRFEISSVKCNHFTNYENPIVSYFLRVVEYVLILLYVTLIL